jgi:hypothetical protein
MRLFVSVPIWKFGGTENGHWGMLRKDGAPTAKPLAAVV